jgi:hypothetical protein
MSHDATQVKQTQKCQTVPNLHNKYNILFVGQQLQTWRRYETLKLSGYIQSIERIKNVYLSTVSSSKKVNT